MVFLESLTDTTKDAVIQTATTWTPQDDEELANKKNLRQSQIPQKRRKRSPG